MEVQSSSGLGAEARPQSVQSSEAAPSERVEATGPLAILSPQDRERTKRLKAWSLSGVRLVSPGRSLSSHFTFAAVQSEAVDPALSMPRPSSSPVAFGMSVAEEIAEAELVERPPVDGANVPIGDNTVAEAVIVEAEEAPLDLSRAMGEVLDSAGPSLHGIPIDQELAQAIVSLNEPLPGDVVQSEEAHDRSRSHEWPSRSTSRAPSRGEHPPRARLSTWARIRRGQGPQLRSMRISGGSWP